MKAPRITLEQWRVLQAVIDQGGYAQAAQHLHRSQSAISYALAKLQQQLGIPLLTIEGRKARLTDAGKLLLRRSRQVLKEATELEKLAQNLEQGWEPEIRLVVDVAFPSALLITALKRFAPLDRGTRVQLNEVVLSGADEALQNNDADLAISTAVPSGFLSDALIEIEFIAVAHPEHPLLQWERTLTTHDLSREMQVVIQDSGQRQPKNVGWLGAEHRWSVSSIDTAITTISHGLGFGWLPRHQAQPQLQAGTLKTLPLEEGQSYKTNLYLTYGRPDNIGPATQLLGKIIRETVEQEHPTAG